MVNVYGCVKCAGKVAPAPIVGGAVDHGDTLITTSAGAASDGDI